MHTHTKVKTIFEGGTKEMAQLLKAFAALAENLNLVLSTHNS